MKFLAILKDSVRESIDFKIFYVMVGLSLLLAVLGLSLSFTPVAGAKEVVRDFAILPLNNDADSLDQAAALNVLFQARPVQFSVKSVAPLEGEADAPASRFKVILEAKFNTAEAAEEGEAHPDQLVQFVRERFGRIEGRSMMEAAEVRLLGWEGFKLAVAGRNIGGRKATLEVLTRPTPATVRFWPHRTEILFGALPLSPKDGVPLFSYLSILDSGVVGSLGSTIAVLVSIIITAFFIPNMLRKGTIDLLLVKPIRRSALLVYKYVGGLVFIFLNTVVAVGAMWVSLGLRSGVWPVTFLLTILVLTYSFAILYAVSTLFGVLTRSPIAAILLTIGIWFFFFAVRAGYAYCELRRGMDRMAQALHDKLGDDGLKALEGVGGSAEDGPRRGRPPRLEEMRFEENWLSHSVTVLYKVLPRTSDLGQILDRRLNHDLAFGDPWPPPRKEKPPPELPGGIPLPQLIAPPPSLAEVLGVSTAFIAVFLGLACWRFAVKDY
jgi:ABC-type transport system involved in multi-copper enzyme maturation permease subunit